MKTNRLTLTFLSLQASQLGSFLRWRYARFCELLRADEDMCVGEIPAADRFGPSVLIASGRLPDAVLGEVEEVP